MKDLFSDLTALCSSGDDAFYSVDHKSDEHTYRVFSYRLASYSDFLKPNALNCRGTMFRVDTPEPELVCLPMEKFFNLGENPFTADIDFNTGDWIAFEKLDGSLISSFNVPDGWDLKSKTSISSDHVELACDLFFDVTYRPLGAYIREQTALGWTVNMELCSNHPKFRIVVPYQKTSLRVLNKRNKQTGEISFDIDLPDELVVRPIDVQVTNEYVESVKSMTDFEGIILFNKVTGQFVKVKTEWYLHRHHFKFNISNVTNVIDMILKESIDDIKALFADDEAMMNYINRIENTVIPFYNHTVAAVNNFFEANKHLSRRDYAILAQQGEQLLMSQKMNMFIGRELTLKDSIVKHSKTLFPELFSPTIAAE